MIFRRHTAGVSVLTGNYVKVCADSLADLEEWAKDYATATVPTCRRCGGLPRISEPIATSPSQRTSLNPMQGNRFKVDGPEGSAAVVSAWSDAYIRHTDNPSWQELLRSEIKARSRLLDPQPGEVLHATFVGDKRVNADVENLVLYNIDSFTRAGRNGIRFEHSAVMPAASDGGTYPYFYRYALVPQANTFEWWQPLRNLASFDWTNLPAFSGE